MILQSGLDAVCCGGAGGAFARAFKLWFIEWPHVNENTDVSWPQAVRRGEDSSQDGETVMLLKLLLCKH